MRIISKIRDYYDIGMGHGYDPSVTYVRTPSSIDLPRCYAHSGLFTQKYIGFCGVVYPLIKIDPSYLSSWGHKRDLLWEKRNTSIYCYSIDQVDDAVTEIFSDEHLERFIEGKYTLKGFLSRFNQSFDTRKSLEAFLNRDPSSQPYYFDGSRNRVPHHMDDVFVEHNVPIFAVEYGRKQILLNPLLRPYDFHKVFDPYTAYCRVSEYVGGVLNASTKEVPEMSDQTKIDARGFTKWSFRKEPSKKTQAKK